jgi:hypothetical protein
MTRDGNDSGDKPEEKNDWQDDAYPHVVEQLLGKSWGELEVLEHYGYLLFPDSIYKRKKDGTFDEIKVCLRVPRQHELRKARVEARRIAMEDGLDLDRDKDLFNDLETICILSMAIRNRATPHESMIPEPRELERDYDRACLMQIWAKLDALHQVVDPAPHKISEEEMFALIAAIAKDRSISPLAVYAADSQANFVIFTASLLASFLVSKSSSEPSDSSMQE